MDCEKFRQLVLEKREGSISPQDEKILDGHLATCGGCREDFELIGATFDALRDVRDEEVPNHYFTNLLPRIHRRIDEGSRGFAGVPLPLWIQRLIAPGSAAAVLGSIVGLYFLLAPSFDPSTSGLQQLVSQVPREDLEQVAESVSYSGPLTRTMEPSQRLLETVASPASLSQNVDRDLVSDQLQHGHSFTVFLAGDSPVEDINEEDVDLIIKKLDQTSL